MRSAEIVRHRMYSQRLWGHPLESPEEAVRWLGALQAQEYAYAKWSVAQRAAGVDEAAMDQALAAGTILRTHLLRPTWHFVLAEDIRWILKISAPRVNALNAYYYRKLGLDDKFFAAATLRSETPSSAAPTSHARSSPSFSSAPGSKLAVFGSDT